MVFCGYCGFSMSPGTPTSGGIGKNRYLTLRCSQKTCQSRFDKKRGLRGKVIFDYILQLLGSGLEVDKTAYNAYKDEAKKVCYLIGMSVFKN